MIDAPTVFILGAGASMAFGFPSGKGLLDIICRNINEKGEEFDILCELSGELVPHAI